MGHRAQRPPTGLSLRPAFQRQPCASTVKRGFQRKWTTANTIKAISEAAFGARPSHLPDSVWAVTGDGRCRCPPFLYLDAHYGECDYRAVDNGNVGRCLIRVSLYKFCGDSHGEATPGLHGVWFFLRLIFLKNSKSSFVNANGLMDLNQNLDTAVNYVPRKRLSPWLIRLPITP